MKVSVFCSATLFSVLISFSYFTSFGQGPNFYEHIAPIIYNKCAPCHHNGGIGPFPFTTYEEIRPFAPWILHAIIEGEMPPWPPDPEYRHFLDENYLTQKEIEIIKQWYNNGSVEGPPMLEPELPEFKYAHNLGLADIELSMKEPFYHIGNSLDSFRVFVLSLNNEYPLHVAAMELECGNETLCHHAIFGFDQTGRAQHLDSLDSGYGYFNATNFGPGVSRNIMDIWVPGKKTRAYPDGTGHIIPANSDLLIHIHYAAVDSAQWDQSSFRLFLADEPIERKIRLATINYHKVVTEPFDTIIANTVRSYTGILPVLDTISMIKVFPHQHLIGKSWEIWAEHPDGTTTNLIKIPQWDFHWQNWYTFEHFLPLYPGDTIVAVGVYDNTIFSHDNPNYPPRDIYRGLGSEDEMFLVKFSWVEYREGDENVYLGEREPVIKVKPPATVSFSVYPNPVNNWLITKTGIPVVSVVSIELVNFAGQRVSVLMPEQEMEKGRHTQSFSTAQIDPGVYFVVMKYGLKAKAEKVVLE